mmetsp:Transcript_73315/g.238603  ORF Transcript_73315/g.238603 Transcript_73315/m.238603 type:complete len:331 (-) Transcript_73315:39-1031(-)
MDTSGQLILFELQLLDLVLKAGGVFDDGPDAVLAGLVLIPQLGQPILPTRIQFFLRPGGILEVELIEILLLLELVLAHTAPGLDLEALGLCLQDLRVELPEFLVQLHELFLQHVSSMDWPSLGALILGSQLQRVADSEVRRPHVQDELEGLALADDPDAVCMLQFRAFLLGFLAIHMSRRVRLDPQFNLLHVVVPSDTAMVPGDAGVVQHQGRLGVPADLDPVARHQLDRLVQLRAHQQLRATNPIVPAAPRQAVRAEAVRAEAVGAAPDILRGPEIIPQRAGWLRSSLRQVIVDVAGDAIRRGDARGAIQGLACRHWCRRREPVRSQRP